MSVSENAIYFQPAGISHIARFGKANLGRAEKPIIDSSGDAKPHFAIGEMNDLSNFME